MAENFGRRAHQPVGLGGGSIYSSMQNTYADYIPQFVGSIVPELKEFTQSVKNRFETALDEEDKLIEALGNFTHLGTEEDTAYANELKEKHYNEIVERARSGNYQSLGRRIRNSASQFMNDYSILQSRQNAMNQIIQKVRDDESIFDPNKKERIIQKIQHINRAQRGPEGELLRDASGKIALGTIQDWSYSPDVDIQKILSESLKNVKANLEQSEFREHPDGYFISSVGEIISKQEVQSMAERLMRSNPQVQAMLETDAELATFDASPEQLYMAITASNLSLYEEMKQQKWDDARIKQYADEQGLTEDDLREKPISEDLLAEVISSGNPDMLKEFYKDQVYKRSVILENSDLAGDIFSYRKESLATMRLPSEGGGRGGGSGKFGKNNQSIANIWATELSKDVSIPTLLSGWMSAQNDFETYQSEVVGRIGEALGRPVYTESQEEFENQRDEFMKILLDDDYMDNAIAKLNLSDPVEISSVRASLEELKQEYNGQLQNLSRANALFKSSGFDTHVKQGVDWTMDFYVGRNANLGPFERGEFKEILLDAMMERENFKFVSDKSFSIFGSGVRDIIEKSANKIANQKADTLNPSEKNKYLESVKKYLKSANSKLWRDMMRTVVERADVTHSESKGKTSPISIPIYTSSGEASNLRSVMGTVLNTVELSPESLESSTTGESIRQFIQADESVKSGDMTYTQALRNGVTLGISPETNSITGKVQFAVTRPDGTVGIFEANKDAVHPSIVDELNTEFLSSAPVGRTLSRSEFETFSAARAIARSKYTYVTGYDLENIPNGIEQRLNDDYKVRTRKHGSGTRYTLLVNTKDGWKEEENLKNTTLEEIEVQLGLLYTNLNANR